MTEIKTEQTTTQLENNGQNASIKFSLREQLEMLQDRTGLSYNKLELILVSYREHILDDIFKGRTFRFGYIATIYAPETRNLNNNFVYPLAYTAKLISKQINVPFYTVLQVLKDYTELAELKLRQGYSFNIIGILKLKPIRDPKTNLVDNISANLSRSINNQNIPLPFKVRAGVLPNFRHRISEI